MAIFGERASQSAYTAVGSYRLTQTKRENTEDTEDTEDTESFSWPPLYP